MPPISSVTDASFETEVVRTLRPTVVLFHATWSGPARMILPIFQELAPNYTANLNFATINIDPNPLVTANYGITQIPTLILLHDGLVVDRITTPISHAKLKAFLELAQKTCI